MTTRTKKQHPADAADREAIARAVEFTAFLRMSPTKKIVERRDTLAEAVAVADEMKAAHPSRGVLVYAITPEGASIPVPADLKDAARQAAATPAPNYVAGRNPAAEGVAAAIADDKARDAGLEIPEFLRRESPGAPGPTTSPTAEHTEIQNEPEMGAKARAVAERKGRAKASAPKAKPAHAEPKPAEQPRTARPRAATQALEEAARAGQIPAAPDFSPPSHKPFRKRLAEITAMVEAGDVAGLRADTTEPKSSSRVMLCRYRDLAIIALEARAAKAAA